MPGSDDRLAHVAFAKNPEHERFVQGFQGRTRGRYALAYLVGVEILAGSDLRKSLEAELGNPVYLPNELCEGRDLAVICDRALRAGISMTRLGELVIPSYKRANPKAFEGKTVMEAFEILEKASREDSAYYGDQEWPAPVIEPGRAVLCRPGRPTPCETFVGTILGLLKAFGTSGTARETGCRWEGRPYCSFEAAWS